MNYTKKIALICFLLISSDSFALIDYSDSSGSSNFIPKSSGAVSVNSSPAKKRVVRKTKSSSFSSKSSSSKGSGNFSLASGYKTISTELGEDPNKTGIFFIDGTFQTGYSVFVHMSYWFVRDDSNSEDYEDEEQESGKGNPRFTLGFNWLRLGSGSNATTFDIYGGINVAQDNSAFATSRNDKIIGFETVKRFYNVALGMLLEYRMTGTPKSEEEMDIGGIKKLAASLGIAVGSDIRFSLEGGTYSISEGDQDRAETLDDSVSFGYISPSLSLRLSRLTSLTLGADFSTKRVQDSELLKARLWDLKGVYGNSIYAGLSMSI